MLATRGLCTRVLQRQLLHCALYSSSSLPPRPESKPSSSSSIFSPDASPWDHLLSDIPSEPPLLPNSRRPSRNPQDPSAADSGARPDTSRRTRREAMTAQEMRNFDEMFNTIFHAVDSQLQPGAEGEGGPSIGIGRTRLGSGASPRMATLYTNLRRQSRKLKWTREDDEELDTLREEMEMCDTDEQLLSWAMDKVFGPPERAKAATPAQASNSGSAATATTATEASSEASDAAPSIETDAESSTDPRSTSTATPPPPPAPPAQDNTFPRHPAAYPHLIAHLMRAFRDKYGDPHVALSIFKHAAERSIPSYVFGCTTPAYNELILTRWTCFRDLRGVHDALAEMRANAVRADEKTRRIVEQVRREVGAREQWMEGVERDEDGGKASLMANLEGGETAQLVSRIEELVVPRGKKRGQKKSRFSAQDEEWKQSALKEDDDGWAFDRWAGKEFEQDEGWRKPRKQGRKRTDGNHDGEDKLSLQ